jgi:hypothetical protein
MQTNTITSESAQGSAVVERSRPRLCACAAFTTGRHFDTIYLEKPKDHEERAFLRLQLSLLAILAVLAILAILITRSPDQSLPLTPLLEASSGIPSSCAASTR